MSPRIFTFTGLLLLATNVLLGALIESYPWANVEMSSSVIVITTILLLIVSHIKLRDAFRISLSLIFALAGVVLFFLALFAPPKFLDNWWLITTIIIIVVEVVLLVITHIVSHSVSSHQ